MIFKGIPIISLIDFPKKVSLVFFTYKCNLRCPYCHNYKLIYQDEYRQLPTLSFDEAFGFIEKRKKLIDGIVITGGEPTIHKSKLIWFLKEVKRRFNLCIKLDSNGIKTNVLQEITNKKLIDYLAMDFKTIPGFYGEKLASSLPLKYRNTLSNKIMKTISWLESIKNKREFVLELRTTLVPEVVNLKELEILIDIVNTIQPDFYSTQTVKPTKFYQYDTNQYETYLLLAYNLINKKLNKDKIIYNKRG